MTRPHGPPPPRRRRGLTSLQKGGIVACVLTAAGVLLGIGAALGPGSSQSGADQELTFAGGTADAPGDGEAAADEADAQEAAAEADAQAAEEAAAAEKVATEKAAAGQAAAAKAVADQAAAEASAAQKAAADRVAAAVAQQAAADAAAAQAAADAAAREEVARQAEQDAALDPRYDTCGEALAHGFGDYVSGVDPEYDWYRDADSDGVVCET